MNPKVAKTFAKLGLGAVASLVVGYTIRLERAAVTKIEEHYDNKKDVEEDAQP